MTVPLDEFESIVDDMEFDESEEAYRRPLRTPSRRGSFQTRSTGSASQGQVQATARSLDAKIETLSTAVRTLATRVNGVVSAQSKTTAVLRKESVERRKALDGVRADLQQTKMLSVLLPMLTTETVDVQLTPQTGGSSAVAGPGPASAGTTRKFLVQPESQLATMLPLFLLLTPTSSGTDGAKSGFGDPMMLMLLLIGLKK